MEYETISHLGDTSSAVAGLFWKPRENWIVVVFKGTSPLGAQHACLFLSFQWVSLQSDAAVKPSFFEKNMASGSRIWTPNLRLWDPTSLVSDAFTKASSTFSVPLLSLRLGIDTNLLFWYYHPRERVFPADTSKIKLGYGSTPYDTISLGIQTLAKWLEARLPDDVRFRTKEGKKRVS